MCEDVLETRLAEVGGSQKRKDLGSGGGVGSGVFEEFLGG